MKILLRILILAGLWAASGYLIGTALEYLGFDYYPLGVIVASINVIIGMLWLKTIIRDPIGDRMFFEGPRPDEEGDIRIGCLWMMPISLAFISLFLWFWAILLRLIDK